MLSSPRVPKKAESRGQGAAVIGDRGCLQRRLATVSRAINFRLVSREPCARACIHTRHLFCSLFSPLAAIAHAAIGPLRRLWVIIVPSSRLAFSLSRARPVRYFARERPGRWTARAWGREGAIPNGSPYIRLGVRARGYVATKNEVCTALRLCIIDRAYFTRRNCQSLSF